MYAPGHTLLTEQSFPALRNGPVDCRDRQLSLSIRLPVFLCTYEADRISLYIAYGLKDIALIQTYG